MHSRLLLALLIATATGCGDPPAGDTVDEEEGARADGRARAGRWRKAEPVAGVKDPVAALEAIGYVAGTQPATGENGVTVHDATRAWEGLNLYTSGHGQTALLIDMDGRVLHRWSFDFREAFPDEAEAGLTAEEGKFLDRRERWRRAYVYPNGDLLAVYEGFGLVKLDKDSKLIWGRRNNAHHDLFVAPDGRIWILSRTAHVVKGLRKDPVLEDFVVVLDPDGNELSRFSVLEAVRQSDFATLVEHAPKHGDIFHTNTIEVLDGAGSERAPFLAAGNVLVSMPALDTVAIIDGSTKKMIWGMTGFWDFQHQPTLLDDGDLLVFDNNGEHGRSKVVEVDPLTQQVVWAYRGDAKNRFHSDSCGTAERLPNGNTLVTESDAGRAFELAPDGTRVWEFHNPARAGEHDELVATLFEVVRLPPDFPHAWAKGE